LTLTVGGGPYSEFESNKKDVERNFLKLFRSRARLRGSCARREAPFAGAPVTNFFHRPFGPGWALVGNAGYNKDPITAQGIGDAFRDAEPCAIALDQIFSGGRSFDMPWVSISPSVIAAKLGRCTTSHRGCAAVRGCNRHGTLRSQPSHPRADKPVLVQRTLKRNASATRLLGLEMDQFLTAEWIIPSGASSLSHLTRLLPRRRTASEQIQSRQ